MSKWPAAGHAIQDNWRLARSFFFLKKEVLQTKINTESSLYIDKELTNGSEAGVRSKILFMVYMYKRHTIVKLMQIV